MNELSLKLDTPHQAMLDIINSNSVEIERATQAFNKTQSQFMDSMLTVSHLTPLRNLRQILAEIKKTKLALGEAYYGLKKKEIEIHDKRSEYQTPIIKIEIEELEWKIACIQDNVNGAIRKLANYTMQYNSILKSHNLENFTEEDFEREEERYHIIKAFEQGLCAARSNGGRIDEGNQIYFHQIGINGTAALIEMQKYFKTEGEIIASGESPDHRLQVEWLESMADKFSGCSTDFAKYKGMESTITRDALFRP